MSLLRYELEEGVWDDEPSRGALFVYFHMSDGQVRWSFIHSPETLAASGDWVGESKVRIHGGANHMIVLSSRTPASVDAAINYLTRTGQLLAFSRPC